MASPALRGFPGADGTTIRYGTTAPSAGIGNNGDAYINTTTNMLYGPKAAGAWPAGVSLASTTPGPGGKSAYQLWLDAGNSGDVTAFLLSLKGKSAYQTWLDLGNTGTQADFIASLKGTGGGAGAGVFDIASFSTTIPLTVAGQGFMPPTTVAGPLTFTPAANAVRGALVYLRLTADGVNAPNFSAFTEWGGSSGYDNTAGKVNQVQFFYDGVDNWWSASQSSGAVATPPANVTAPTQMAAPVASAGINSATVTLTAPSSNGGAAVTGYTVVSNPAGGVDSNAGTTSLTHTITGLTAGTAYTFTATAINTAGTSPASPASNSVTPTSSATVPAAPTIGTAVAGDGYVDVYFTRNSNGGSAVIDSTATLSTGQTATGAASPIRVTALNGTAVTATVKDRNSVGSSAASAASNSVTPAVAQAGTYSHLTALDHMAETGTGPYVYTMNATAGQFNTQGGVTLVKRQIGSASSAAIVNTTANELIFGTTNSATAVGFAAMPQAIWAKSAGGNYTPFTLGSAGAPTTAMANQAGDVTRLRWASGNLIAEVARAASPTSFTPVYTWVGVDIATGVAVNIITNGNFSGVQTVGFA